MSPKQSRILGPWSSFKQQWTVTCVGQKHRHKNLQHSCFDQFKKIHLLKKQWNHNHLTEFTEFLHEITQFSHFMIMFRIICEWTHISLRTGWFFSWKYKKRKLLHCTTRGFFWDRRGSCRLKCSQETRSTRWNLLYDVIVKQWNVRGCFGFGTADIEAASFIPKMVVTLKLGGQCHLENPAHLQTGVFFF